MGSFAHLEFSFVNKTIRPALVILSSRIYGCDPWKATVLASVFQFIYMASSVHQGISENDSDYIRGDSDPRDGSQFPVLVGDYLYGKFFTFLCDAGIINLLHPLAEIICQIHEGGIIRKKIAGQSLSSQLYQEVVRKETAELFAGCCAMGARLTGAPEGDQKLLRRFGRNLGMAYGLLEEGAPPEYTASFLEAALENLLMLPDKPERTVLRQLVHSLSPSGLVARRMVI
ncbi:MAG: polyprenyl synthetase family protein [Peptococcaceae bacterium]|nr:polyprenyl synthetase family protein [Peptococcaceae bacterium]